jgi:hypothetical protein
LDANFQIVRRQGFWNKWRPNLRESLARLVGLIMRHAGGDASAKFRAFFVRSFLVALFLDNHEQMFRTV